VSQSDISAVRSVSPAAAKKALILDFTRGTTPKRFVESRGFEAAAYKGLNMEHLLSLQSPIVPSTSMAIRTLPWCVGSMHPATCTSLTPHSESMR
jgi:hypothetical protein